MKSKQLISHGILVLGIFLGVIFGWDVALAQDSSKAKFDSTKFADQKDSTKTVSHVASANDINLEDIVIQAVVEKPRVAILPKRLEPNLSKVEFVERSFENELKKIPKNPMLLGNDKKIGQKIRKFDVHKKEKNKPIENEKKEPKKTN